MGVKSTVMLSRNEAENRYADLIMRYGNPKFFIFKDIGNWETDYLEEQLEEMNDQANEGEGFENYIIEEEE